MEGKEEVVSSHQHGCSPCRRLSGRPGRDWISSRRGEDIRYHSHFAPKGTNADFVRVEKGSHLSVRTYERGVEDETLACGTGVVASALIAAFKGMVKSPVSDQDPGRGGPGGPF